MNREAGEGLSSALGESQVRDGWLVGSLQYVIYAVGDVVKRKLINGKRPKAPLRWSELRRLLGILVPSIVSKLQTLATA